MMARTTRGLTITIRIRAEIERSLPAALGRLARFAEIFREQVRRTLVVPRSRRRFWDRVFEGRVDGVLVFPPRGEKGFGYDPIFIPEGDTRHFAEMSLEEKNLFSHRRKATDQLITFLQSYTQDGTH